MNKVRAAWLAAAIAGATLVTAADAEPTGKPAASGATFTTLGTNSGPIPNARRAEPANLLRADGRNILIDVGDGAAWQLGKAGVDLAEVNTVVISHLHFDHVGGLFALLSQRYQALAPGPVTIYGPPGTKELVASLVAAMNVASQRAMNMRQRASAPPGDNLTVIEIGDGATFTVGNVKVTSVANTHFSASPAANDPTRLSLSFRFDVPGRSILYTGDTGPSPKVEALAKGVDLLVCEIMDPEIALAQFKAARPNVPDAALAMVREHFRREHMSPGEVGLLASRAAVKALVLTHDAIPYADIAAARKAIAAKYVGPVTFAEDLATF